MEDPREDSPGSALRVCSGSTLFGDLWVSRSVECDFLSVLSYHWFFFSIYCTVSSIIRTSYYVVSYNCFLHVRYVGLVVSTCQMIG